MSSENEFSESFSSDVEGYSPVIIWDDKEERTSTNQVAKQDCEDAWKAMENQSEEEYERLFGARPGVMKILEEWQEAKARSKRRRERLLKQLLILEAEGSDSQSSEHEEPRTSDMEFIDDEEEKPKLRKKKRATKKRN